MGISITLLSEKLKKWLTVTENVRCNHFWKQITISRIIHACTLYFDYSKTGVLKAAGLKLVLKSTGILQNHITQSNLTF